MTGEPVANGAGVNGATSSNVPGGEAGGLRLLLLEDNPLDAELALENLHDGGVRCEALRVAECAQFRDELERRCPDLILSDFSLPGFDGLAALQLAQAICPDVPFIFVSGALGEELAIETLKRGATDYVLKHRLERLVPSVQRALREARERAERRRLEEELRRQAEELRRQAEQLAEADRRKDEFLAMLAHELRNPLAPIFTALHLLDRSEADPLTAERSRRVVERQVRHMARLLDDLLDISRISRGKILLRRESLDLGELIQGVVEDHRVAVEAAGITLTCRLPDQPVPVYGDRTRLAQVIGNLLSNSRKFTPGGGYIEIDLETDAVSKAARLRILDTGVGVEPDQLQRIFEPFAQGREVQQRESAGLGLGLALVRGLIEQHGGSVDARSEGRGRGAEFRLTLPLAPAAYTESTPVMAPESPAKPGVSGAASRRVLVIDDNRDAADTLGELLEWAGHDVRVAYSGSDGIELARQFTPDTIFCDLGLPGIDGFQVANALRDDPLTREARLIAVSGYGQLQDQERSRAAGFSVHLTKPVDPEHVRAMLR